MISVKKLFGRKTVGTDMVGSVLGTGIGAGQANAASTDLAAPSTQLMAQQQAIQNAYNSQLASVFGSHTHTMSPSTYPMPTPRYLSYNIIVRETSNGYVITLGEIVRVCPSGGEGDALVREIAAAIGEYMLSIKEGER